MTKTLKYFCMMILFKFTAAPIASQPTTVIPNIHEKPGWLTGIKFHPTQNFFVVSYFQNNAIIVYDSTNIENPTIKQVIEKPYGGPARPHEMVFNPQGTYAILCDYDSNILNVYRCNANSTLTLSHTFTPSDDLNLFKPHSMAFHPSGNYFAITHCDCKYDKKKEKQNAIIIWGFDDNNGAIESTPRDIIRNPELSTYNPKGVAFSPAGTTLLATMSDSNMIVNYKIDNPLTGKVNHAPQQIIENGDIEIQRPEDILFSPDENYVLFANSNKNSILSLGFDNSTQMISPVTQPMHVLENPAAKLSYPHGLSFSPDKKYLGVSNFGRDQKPENRGDRICIYKCQS